MYLVLLLVCNTVMFAQKVILTPTAVNGASVSSSGPINLGGTPSSTVSLGIRVEMPSVPGNTGTISIYSLNGLNANVVTGGNGGSLIFNEGNVASRSFVVNLNWSAFPTSGGFIFAEYKTASGVAYKSGYISVVKNTTMGGGTINPPADAPNPSKIANTLCCNQTVRLGDKPAPIVGSQYVDPYENFIYGINNRWNANNGRILSLDNTTKTLHLDYTTELKNITVTRELGYKGNNEYPNKSNTINITVVPTPILRNTISVNESLNSEGFVELSSIKNLTISGFSSVVNLKVLQDPFYTIQTRDPGAEVDGYKWEYTKTNSALGGPRIWVTIPNENSSNLTFYDPSEKSNLEDTYYLIRRIAIYQNITNVTEPIKVLIRGIRYNNTICCDQSLKITTTTTEFEKPQIISGSTPFVESNIVQGTGFLIKSITYQWQNQSLQGSTPSIWYNISGATSKDYLPTQPLTVSNGGGRRPTDGFEVSYKYRRIANINYHFYNDTNKLITGIASSYSNETFLIGSKNEPFLKLYPNPSTSILNIESTVDLTNVKLTISNIMGTIVNSNDYSLISPKLISINVANYPTGTYFITIENQNLGVTQRAFIKQ